jgi:Sulfotransferase family
MSSPTDSIAGKRLVFLVGAPRSGTTWVQLMLASADEVATANESHLFSEYLASLFNSWDAFRGNAREIGIHHLMTEDEYLSLVRDFASGVMARILAKKPNASIILEKTPQHVKVWRWILQTFPDSCFLHLVRDPRSVVASLQAAQATWGRHWLSPRLIDYCSQWRYCIEQGREIGKHTKNYTEVRYEDFINDGAQTLRSVFAWLGVERAPAECKEIIDRFSIDKLRSGAVTGTPWDLAAEPPGFYRRGNADGWVGELSPSQISLVEAMTKEVMPIFEYRPVSRTGRISRLASLRLVFLRERIRAALYWRLGSFLNKLSPRERSL